MLSIGVLASGNLGLSTLQDIKNQYPISFVLTDKKSQGIIDYCEDSGIPIYAGKPNNSSAIEFYKKFNIDVIISVNYLFIIEPELIEHSNVLTFNLHGSLLPKYRGRTPHVWSIINNEKECGITAHKIDAGCDTGDIIKQVIVPIEENDTGAHILHKYAELYYPIIESVLEDVSSNNLKYTSQNNDLATYYGKRTPEDGRIDWNWEKERIRNWIRAQATPYPGAFTILHGSKIIIDKVSFSDFGYTFELENGSILQTSPNLIVKTPNGAIQIDQLREITPKIELKTGMVLK